VVELVPATRYTKVSPLPNPYHWLKRAGAVEDEELWSVASLARSITPSDCVRPRSEPVWPAVPVVVIVRRLR
jgi:hypothetical protein